MAVVYSKSTGRIRRWLVPDYDWEIDSMFIHPGEASLSLEDSCRSYDEAELQKLVNSHTGNNTPGDHRHAVVKDGVVLAAILADPTCGDYIEGHELICHEHAGPGWKHHPVEGFIAPERVVEEPWVDPRTFTVDWDYNVNLNSD